ncbi:MAG TPA: Uma2 family endonuclease, partial [Pyrinomonadaceae bacterium]
MSSRRKTLLTPDEYLAVERGSEVKSEYLAGEVFAMVGASRRHNLIASNIIRVLGNQLLERPCNVYPSDMRVKVGAIGKYTYPDVTVACAEEMFDDAEQDTLLNPLVIVEVLSESTEAYDRGKKF